MTQHLNFEFWSGDREVCVVNDNSGQLFQFEKLAQGETWVTRDAVDQVNAQRTSANLSPVAVRYTPGSLDERALGSIKRTDLLVLGLHDIPSTLDLSPVRSNGGAEGRAALYSFGFLLRRAAAVLLDVNEQELRVGLRIVRNERGSIIGQVFLSDALENGAGYCSQFASQSAMEDLLRFVADPSSSLLAPIVSERHADRCQTSCPDCLRDYSNLAWHNILDWRMALDVARLALDVNAQVDLSIGEWRRLVDTSAPPYFRALGWSATTFAGLAAAQSVTRAEIIVHPLWSSTHPTLVAALANAQQSGIAAQTKTLFEILRRPF